MSKPTSLPPIIFVLGPPGGGKSTLCRLAGERIHGVKHVVMSDLLREAERNASAAYAEEIARNLAKGTLVSGEVAMAALGEFLSTLPTNPSPTILLDGFPRDIEQAQSFENQVRYSQNLGNATATISLICSAATCKKRREDRARLDDAPEKGDARYRDHLRNTVPAIEYLRGNNCQIVEVSSEKDGDEGYLPFKDALMDIINAAKTGE
ncbi:MAG: hypothetical protein Q9184_002519 [Pyrenodesmia sp. 2 TL-2023]